jgi:hypothetical protein
MWFRAIAVPVGIIILLAVGGIATAQDDPMAGDDPMGADVLAPEAQPEEGLDEGPMTEGAIDEAAPVEKGYEDDLRERYFRITEDFISPQAIGLGEIGRVPAFGKGVLRAGPFRFNPSLRMSVGWKSNVFLDEGDDQNPVTRDQDEEDSWFWEASASLLGDAHFLADRLTLRTALRVNYRDYFESDITNDWQAVMGLAAKYAFPMGVWFEIGATYKHLVDPIDEEDAPGRMSRSQWDYKLDIGIDQLAKRVFADRLSVVLGFDFRTRNFEDTEHRLGDRWEAEGTIRVSYRLIRDVAVFIEYAHEIREVESERLNDGDNDTLRFGMDGAYPLTQSGRLQGQIFVGFRRDEYDDPKEYRVDSYTNSTDTEDMKNSLNAGIMLRYLMGTRMTATLQYIRSTEFSLHANYQEVDRLDLGLTRLIIPGLTGNVAGYYEIDHPSRGRNEHNPYKGHNVYRSGAGVGLRHVINDFMDVDVSGNADWRNDTDPNGKDYVSYTGMLGLTFYLR